MPFIHCNFSWSNMAEDLVIRSNVKLSMTVWMGTTSVLSSNDQPSSTMKFSNASGKHPASLYSPMAVAPWRLDSLARSGPIIMDKWANCGGSNPNALNSCRWRGVLGSHSSARITWLISIR